MFSSKVGFNLSMLYFVLACVWYGMESALNRGIENYALMMVFCSVILAIINYKLWSIEENKKEKDSK